MNEVNLIYVDKDLFIYEDGDLWYVSTEDNR
jgi:hypothetical protein